MVNLMDLVTIAGMPVLGASGKAVLKIYDSVDKVKVHKQRCRLLRNQCVETLNALKDKSSKVEPTSELQEALDIFQAKVQCIHGKMEEWAALSLMKSIVKQSDISTGLDELFHDLHYCSERFQMVSQVELTRLAEELLLTSQRDAAELREQLLQLVRKTDALDVLLTDAKDVEQLMQTLQEEIQSEPPSAGGVSRLETDRDNLDLQKALYYLHKEADLLPPITDLTSEIEKITEHPVTHGGDNDVYIGRWLGQESVALKFTRGCNHSETAKKRFFNEVSIWRRLKHQNIVRLYGTASFGGCIFTVSPWMDNGDATQFLVHNPDHDRRQLLLEVAQGLQYLHNHGVAHGDVRCANVLISRERVARLSDFGLSVLIYDIAEAAGSNPTTRDANLGGLRWRAPELIDPPVGSRPVITPATDVWSYGMLCLEVMTGERPFHGMGLGDVGIMKAIVGGNLPSRPTHTYAPLDDSLWHLIQLCWKMDPELRPWMHQVVNKLRRAISMIDSGDFSSSPSTVTSALPNTPPSDPTGAFPSEGSAISEPNIELPSMIGENGHLPSSPSDRSTISQYPRSFASFHHDPITEADKPLPQRPISRFLSTGWTQSLHNPTRRETTPFAHPTFSGELPQTTRQQTSPTSSHHLPTPGNSTNSHSPSSYLPPNNFRQSILFQPLKPTRPTRNPNRPIGDNSPTSPYSEHSINSPNGYRESQYSVQDDSQLLRFSEDGSVRCGTVPALVRRLFTETDSLIENIEFRDAFLTCYTAFMTAEDLFKFLRTTYDAVEEEPPRDEMVQIRYTILTVLRAWLIRHRAFPKDAALVQEIREFAEGIANPHTIKKAAEQVLDVLRSKELEIIRPRRFNKAHSSKIYDNFRASLAHPREFAIGFTIMAWDMYADLLPSDFIAWLMESNTLGGRENIESHLAIWTKISYWTRNLILQPDKENARTARLTLFISIANECRKLHNYTSMNAIVAGCSSPLIRRLRYTFGDLDRTAKEALESMVALGDAKDSFRKYRNELDHYGHQKPLIPDIAAVHAQDIRTSWSAKVGTVHIGGERLVNFERYVLLTELINRILSYQKMPIDLERYRESGPLAYLECQLDKFEVTEEVQRSIQSRSEKLQKIEETAYKGRYREVKMAGFDIPSHKGKR